MGNPRFNPKLQRRNEAEKWVPLPVQSLIDKLADQKVPYSAREVYMFQLLDIESAIIKARNAYNKEGLDRVNKGKTKKTAPKSLKQ